jgi:hypothetical protein
MVKSTYIAVALLLFLLVTLGQKPASFPHEDINKQLRSFAKRGMSYHFLDNYTIEIADTLMGWKEVKTLWQPYEATIRSWAATRNIPVIEIDPTLVDTSKWTGCFDYWATVPIGNSLRIQTQIQDFDGNGYPEVYGTFGWVGDPENRVYEVYPDGSSHEKYVYIWPAPSFSTHVSDIDRNGLQEVAFERGGVSYFYEQTMPSSLPTELKCVFNMYDGLAAYLTVGHVVDMDGDSATDFVHKGADTALTPYYLACVSEYDSSTSNFMKAWHQQPPLHSHWEGYDVGDYNNNGRMELLLSYTDGHLVIYENTGDNAYAIAFQDSLPLVNMVYQTSGDVDGDGKREFFVGATMSSGNWTVMYKADGGGRYHPTAVLNLLSGGSLDDPTYFSNDIDRDGRPELAILSGGYLYVFKSDSGGSFSLWYLKSGPSSISVTFHDMDGDGIKDILWTAVQNVQYVSIVYKGSPLMSVPAGEGARPNAVSLMQNYPNPFNPSTTVTFSLPRRDYVMLAVYDILGREVARLADGAMDAGTHRISWDAARVTSGVYLYRLRTSGGTISRKMIVVK